MKTVEHTFPRKSSPIPGLLAALSGPRKEGDGPSDAFMGNTAD